MAWVANFSMKQIEEGEHFTVDNKTILIQIQDPDTKEFINPKYKKDFNKIYQFKFWDAEDEKDIPVKDKEGLFSNKQSLEISKIIQDAKENNLNIVIHCHAGICRSGAITEVCGLYGFDIENQINNRIPNKLVFNKLRKNLGLLYSWE